MHGVRASIHGFWWRLLGWIMLLLGVVDYVAGRAQFEGRVWFYQLGIRDRMWAWLTMGVIALAAGSILQAITDLPAAQSHGSTGAAAESDAPRSAESPAPTETGVP